MHKNCHQELTAAHNHNKQLESSLENLKQDATHLRIELSAARKTLSFRTVEEKTFSILLALVLAFLGLGVTPNMPVIERVVCFIGFLVCGVWILYSNVPWFKAFGVIQMCVFGMSLIGLCASASYTYFRDAYFAERSSATDGDLIPIAVKGNELPAPGVVAVEIGDSGVILFRDKASERDQEFFKFLTDQGVNIRPGTDGPILSTAIKDWNGNTVGEIEDNHWRISNKFTSDKNYNSNALEVKDNSGHIIFQVRLLKDRVQLQGEWHDQFGGGRSYIKDPQLPGLDIADWTSPAEWKLKRGFIKPLFKYPSDKHWRELATK